MRKLMWLTIGFFLAAGLGSYVLLPNMYFYAAGGCALLLAVSLALMLRFSKLRLAAMVLFGCCIAFLWQAGFDHFYLSTARACDDQKLNLTITATDYSYKTDYGAAVEGRVELDGKTYSVRAYHDRYTMLIPGDSLTGDFLLRSTLHGGTGESEYNRSSGIFLSALPRGDLSVSYTRQVPLTGFPAFIRRQISSLIDRIFPADSSGFAKALLLGDTDGIDYETDTAFKLSGIRHVIAVSGLHVTILFSLVYAFTGRRKWLTAILGLPVLFVFAAIAGFSPSITRACIMHALMVIALLFNREYDRPTALSFAVLVMLLCNPWTVTNVGFQLSVGCMVGIFLFSEKMENWLMDKKRLGRFKGKRAKLAAWFSVSVSISISATIITTPLCAYYFGVVSLVGTLTNLLALWIITYIFYGIMLSCVASMIFAPLGTAIAWVVSWGIRYVLLVSKMLAAFPLAAVSMQSIYNVFWLILCYCLLVAFMLSKRKHPFVLVCCATIGLCIALFASWMEPLRDDCRVTILDVGQGQCILLQSEGKNYLVDCGGDSDTAAADKAAGLLLSQGIHRLDGIFITHYDRDHAGGAVNLLQRVKTDALYLPNCADEDGTAEDLKRNTDGRILTISQDLAITFGENKITLIPAKSGFSNNENGLCVLFQTENCDILITGDRDAKGERELIAHMTLPELEVLIVGHHGSKTSTSRELLIKTSPEIAIISVGADNPYGHPTDEVLQRLMEFGCTIYRTDRDGTVIYRG